MSRGRNWDRSRSARPALLRRTRDAGSSRRCSGTLPRHGPAGAWRAIDRCAQVAAVTISSLGLAFSDVLVDAMVPSPPPNPNEPPVKINAGRHCGRCQ